MIKRRKIDGCPFWIAVVIVVLTLYSGMYALTVGQVYYVHSSTGVIASETVEPIYAREIEPFGDCANSALDFAFTPVHWLDRQIRPTVWTIPPPSAAMQRKWRERVEKYRRPDARVISTE